MSPCCRRGAQNSRSAVACDEFADDPQAYSLQLGMASVLVNRQRASGLSTRRLVRNIRYHRLDARLLWRQQFRERVAQFRPVIRLL